MKGWRIFLHSLRMVIDNIGTALRVSLVLYLVQVASQIATYLHPSETGPDGMPVTMIGVPALALMVLAVLASLWIAVAWHRFVLTGEEPRGWLPQWHGGEILGYFGRSILIALVIFLGMMLSAIPVALVGAAVPALAPVLVFGLVGLGGYLFFRLGLILPASALGEKLTLKQAWRATSDDDGAVVTLALLVIGGSLLVELPALIDDSAGSIVNLVYGLVINWFATMIGISVLTSLYGHFVEKRPIG
ncbi:hypothetical protein [Alloyangia pacifica]|uniref:Uncharacterized protein n=1 Tax=Alloyangia pacifica TaxID=311180 RepID=A0A1I6U255_9RHOB|nr:hypothetical protein [Alloyangia pacifica]SDH34690.1 hypothetical protein SAMN04488245_10777 [Alloyangia pacifica]SFS95438.1 hypothetical protein SAMN04488050_10777 [Alloyangia pacifica]